MNSLEYLGSSFNKKTKEIDKEKIKKETYGNKSKLNIVLFGATGVGKSSLVNAVFGDDIVKSGVGEPITQFLEKIEIKSKGLTLWDTKGIEAKDYENTKELLIKDIDSGFQKAFDSNDDDEAPHVVWLCIKESSGRIEEREHDLISIAKKFGIPTIIVFTNTQFEEGEKFCEEAKNNINTQHKVFLNNRYVRVNSVTYKFRNEIVPVCGLAELLSLTEGCFSDARHNAEKQRLKKKHIEALRMAQEVNMQIKINAMVESADLKIRIATMAAAAAGTYPIPALMAAIHKKLIYMLNTDFEINNEDSYITNLNSEIIKAITAETNGNLRKSFSSIFLRSVPIVNNLMAIRLTQSLGQSYIILLTEYFDKEKGKVIFPRQDHFPLSFFKFNFEQEMKDFKAKESYKNFFNSI